VVFCSRQNVTPAEFTERVGGEDVLKKWQLLYCGGSKPVLNSLQHTSLKYGVKLRTEKFDW
jgi:hypothetical protein